MIIIFSYYFSFTLVMRKKDSEVLGDIFKVSSIFDALFTVGKSRTNQTMQEGICWKGFMVTNRASGIADDSSLWKDRKLRHPWYLMANNKDPNALILSPSCSRRLHIPLEFSIIQLLSIGRCFRTLGKLQSCGCFVYTNKHYFIIIM